MDYYIQHVSLWFRQIKHFSSGSTVEAAREGPRDGRCPTLITWQTRVDPAAPQFCTPLCWHHSLRLAERVPMHWKRHSCDHAHKYAVYSTQTRILKLSEAPCRFSCALRSPSLSDDIIPWQCHHSYKCCLQNLELDSYCACAAPPHNKRHSQRCSPTTAEENEWNT